MYDLIIIGSGPAGMTAAIYAVRREMKTLVIGKETGGQMIWASEIENYPGFESIKSFELIQRIKDQVVNFGAELKIEEVVRIEKLDKIFRVQTANANYEAKTVLIAMGLSPRQLSVPGEKELNGKGVSYCVNCDGPFFRDKQVAVIGAGNAALDAAEVMSKIAKKVYLINRGGDFKAFDTLVKEVKNRDNIEIILYANTKEIVGDNKVEKLIYTNLLDKKDEEIEVDGVFIEIGRIASTDLVADLVKRDINNQIIVTNDMETMTPGLFAAGDATTVKYKQITIAMGQATIAALSAYQYIQMNPELL